MYVEIQSREKGEIVAFVERHLSSLSEQRLEITQSSSGELFAQLIDATREPSESITA